MVGITGILEVLQFDFERQFLTLLGSAYKLRLARGGIYLESVDSRGGRFTSFIVALIALMSLSIPRRIVVTDEKVEVRCLLDITEIRRDEIASVRRVDPRRMKWFFPVFGGCGFFGYYGHFLDLRRFERVKLYASEWKNFVDITDIYEYRLYVSCSDAGRLVEELMPPGGNRPAEDDEEEEQAQ